MKAADWFFVAALLLFAFGLRVLGISYGQPDPQYASSTYPYQMLHDQTPMQPDEYISVGLPVEMLLKRRLNPNFFEYPTLIVNLNLAGLIVTDATRDMSLQDRSGKGIREFAPFSLYVFSRMFSVLGSLLAVAAAYAVMRKVAGKYAALSAGLLVATSFTLVQHAHYIKPGSLASGWMMLALWASFTALYAHRATSRHRMIVLAGLITGLAATTRYNAAAIGIILFLTSLVLLYRHRDRRTVGAVLLSWLLVPVIFVIGTPYAVLDFPQFMRGVSYIFGQFLYTGANVPAHYIVDRYTGAAFVLRYLLIFSVGLPASLALIIGLFAAWRARPLRAGLLRDNSPALFTLIVGLMLLAYAWVTFRTIRPGHSENLLILIVPQCALLASLGADWLYRRLPLPKTLTAPLVITALITFPLVMSVQTTRMFTQPDTRQIMQAWVYEHLPHQATIFLNGPYNVPLDPADFVTRQRFNTYAESPAAVPPDADYMIFSDTMLFDVQRSWEYVSADVITEWQGNRAWLDERYERIAHIDRPVWTGSDWVMNTASYWHNPALTVYCLSDEACAGVMP